MSVQWKITCAECGKKGSFGDEKDISHAKWKIIAWRVKESEPLCVCEKCEYHSSPEQSKTK
jgi:hypothetical protein